MDTSPSRMPDEPPLRSSRGANEQLREQLQEQLTALEGELARSEASLADTRARHDDAERRALAAIRAGDDRAAWLAFEEQRSHGEQAALLAADCHVLHVLVDECRDALGKGADRSAAGDSS